MKLQYTGRNIEVTDALREVADKKYSRLDKYFHEETEAHVTFLVEKNDRTAEVTIHLPGTILRSEQTSEDMYTSIDKTVDALEAQIRKHKTRLQRRRNHEESIRFENIQMEPGEEEKEEKRIVKVKRFSLKPMDPEEASMQMELLGHNFFVFRDSETDQVHVIYKRRDGNYGLIESE